MELFQDSYVMNVIMNTLRLNNMTAPGVLLVDEDVRDMIEEQLEKDLKQKFKDELVSWKIYGEQYSDIWNLADMPDDGEAPILGEFESGEKQIGVAYFKMKFSIEGGFGEGRYINGELKSAHYFIFSKPKEWKEV